MPNETGGAFPAWQPIATAPKDGTQILAIVHPYGYPNDTSFEIIFYYPSKFFWSSQGYGDPDIDWGMPTHWLPLPPAPGKGGDSDV
ncbi:hypothetical protein ACN6KF_003011 [Labrys sp. La1]|uniref:hypothetical protein n=1 Tax=Labrys sp. La1 TaxID=3404917 RepID=UPI003EC0130F